MYVCIFISFFFLSVWIYLGAVCAKKKIPVGIFRIDDPLMWGVLPFRYHFHPENHRWSLGSHDIVFTNKFVLPNFFFFDGCQDVLVGSLD